MESLFGSGVTRELLFFGDFRRVVTIGLLSILLSITNQVWIVVLDTWDDAVLHWENMWKLISRFWSDQIHEKIEYYISKGQNMIDQ